jgi:hypothetical protein
MDKRKFVHNAGHQGAEGFFRYLDSPQEENLSPLLLRDQLAPPAIGIVVIVADKNGF